MSAELAGALRTDGAANGGKATRPRFRHAAAG